MSIQLTDSTGGQLPSQESNTDLTAGGYVKASVSHGTWIMYRTKNFNDEIAGGSHNAIMILDTVGDYDISGHNGSMYLVSSDSDALVLFNACYFGGVSPNPKTYTENVYYDITKDFPAGGVGASSAIVVGNEHDWELFTQKNCQGAFHTLKRDQRYENFIKLGINDLVKSLRKK